MKKYLGYIITFIVGLFMIFGILLAKDIFQVKGKEEIYHILTDAIFVPGVLITGYGILVMANNEGAFDMLTYGVIKLFDLFKRDLTKVKHRTFYDYRQAKRDSKNDFGYLIIVGVSFIVVSLIFYYLYYLQTKSSF